MTHFKNVSYAPLFILSLILIMTGCNDDFGTDPPQPVESFFEASVSGAVTRDYRGTAIFGLFTDPQTEAEGILFELISDDPLELQGIGFTGKMAQVPAVNSYSIVKFENLNENGENPLTYLEDETFIGLFIPGQDGEHSDLFASEEGNIDIIERSDDRLIGEFTFSAFGYRLDDITDTVWVDIEGQFEAARVEIQL